MKWRPVGVVVEAGKPEVIGFVSSRVKADFISSHIHLTIYISLKKTDLSVPPLLSKENLHLLKMVTITALSSIYYN